MWDRMFYYAKTFAEAGLSLFGVRGMYEQPAYTVRDRIGDALEVRDYAPRLAVETTAAAADRSGAANAAFQRLFGYIAGGNRAKRTVAMTAPVQQMAAGQGRGQLIAMTTPVQSEMGDGAVTMRFFLPRAVAESGAPEPSDPEIRLVSLPATTLATLQFTGPLTDAARTARERQLLEALAGSSWQAEGRPFLLGYDPPFTLPALRRNEVAVAVSTR